MLKRLRVKFIALNMIIAAAVLVLTFSAVCILDYQQSRAQVFEELEITLQHILTPDDPRHQKKPFDDGRFGVWDSAFEIEDDDLGELDELEDWDGSEDFGDLKDAPLSGSADDADDANDAKISNDQSNMKNSSSKEASAGSRAESFDQETTLEREGALPPRIGGPEDERSIPIAAYLLINGSLVELTKHSTASVAEDILDKAAQEVAYASDGRGELSHLGLFYAKTTFDDETFVAFADANAANGWQSVVLILVGVGLVALGIFFVISLFFSRWALTPVAKAWEKQRQFVADASHDLKTPLTVILANSSILAEHPEKTVAEQLQWVESTEHEALSMQALVGDLLTLAQIDEAEISPHLAGSSSAREMVDFSNLVEGELLQMESLAFEHGIDLNSSVTPGLFVSGEAAHLRRIVTTLVDNACKYAGAGQSVSVNLASVGRKAVLTVHNTGPAIDAADLPHIFDRFYRADKARNRNDIGGHGLGLAIAQALATEYGGALTAQSTELEGTTFTLTLPLGQA